MAVPSIPRSRRSWIATPFVRCALDVVAMPAMAFEGPLPIPVRPLDVPMIVTMPPVSGDMAVARRHPLPCAAVPEVPMPIPCPMSRHPDIAGHRDGDILDHGLWRHSDVDAERYIAPAEAEVGVVGEG